MFLSYRQLSDNASDKILSEKTIITESTSLAFRQFAYPDGIFQALNQDSDDPNHLPLQGPT